MSGLLDQIVRRRRATASRRLGPQTTNGTFSTDPGAPQSVPPPVPGSAVPARTTTASARATAPVAPAEPRLRAPEAAAAAAAELLAARLPEPLEAPGAASPDALRPEPEAVVAVPEAVVAESDAAVAESDAAVAESDAAVAEPPPRIPDPAWPWRQAPVESEPLPPPRSWLPEPDGSQDTFVSSRSTGDARVSEATGFEPTRAVRPPSPADDPFEPVVGPPAPSGPGAVSLTPGDWTAVVFHRIGQEERIVAPSGVNEPAPAGGHEPATSIAAADPPAATAVAEISMPAVAGRPEPPVIDEPIIDEPIIDEPIIDEPIIDEPIIEEPVVYEPVVYEPVVYEPVVYEPVAPEPELAPEPEPTPDPASEPEPEPTIRWRPPEPEPAPEPESAYAPEPGYAYEPVSLPEPEPTLTPALPDVPATPAAPRAPRRSRRRTKAPRPSESPSYAERGRMRRRLRYLRALREIQLRDIGGFAVELHRFDRDRPDLLQAKIAGAVQTDAELRALEGALDEGSSIRALREAGIGGACDNCGAIHGSADRYCSTCGASLDFSLYEDDDDLRGRR